MIKLKQTQYSFRNNIISKESAHPLHPCLLIFSVFENGVFFGKIKLTLTCFFCKQHALYLHINVYNCMDGCIRMMNVGTFKSVVFEIVHKRGKCCLI